jgi:phage shock protein C
MMVKRGYWEQGAEMKKLYKSRKHCVIDGVCGGIGEYLGVDPVLVRIVALLFLFAGGAAFIAYIIGMIIIPKEPYEGVNEAAGPSNGPTFLSDGAENAGKTISLIFGAILVAVGLHFLLRNIPFFHYYYMRFWHLGWSFFWPSVLILVGLLVILKGYKR